MQFLHAALAWLAANRELLLAILVAALVVAGHILPYTNKVKANTVVELIFNIVMKLGAGQLPLVGKVLALLATPPGWRLVDSNTPDRLKLVEKAVDELNKPSIVLSKNGDVTVTASDGKTVTLDAPGKPTKPNQKGSARMGAIGILAAIGLLALAAALSCGCAPGTDSARQAITATELTIEATSSALLEFDKTKQAQIVAEAKTDEDGFAQLEAYRAKRNALVESIIAAQAVVSLATAVVAQVDAKAQPASALNAILGQLFDVGVKVSNAVQAFIAASKAAAPAAPASSPPASAAAGGRR